MDRRVETEFVDVQADHQTLLTFSESSCVDTLIFLYYCLFLRCKCVSNYKWIMRNLEVINMPVWNSNLYMSLLSSGWWCVPTVTSPKKCFLRYDDVQFENAKWLFSKYSQFSVLTLIIFAEHRPSLNNNENLIARSDP